MRSKSTLFLIEQLLVVAVFAICAAACVRILTDAYFTATKSRDISNAIHAAESGAESFKAVGGDIAKVAEIMGGVASSTDGAVTAIVFFDSHWQVSGEAGAHYRLLLTAANQYPQATLLITGELAVERLTGESLIAFPVAAAIGDRRPIAVCGPPSG